MSTSRGKPIISHKNDPDDIYQGHIYELILNLHQSLEDPKTGT